MKTPKRGFFNHNHFFFEILYNGVIILGKGSELAVLTNALSIAIANTDLTTDELALIATIFVQIGDTLATIVAQRTLGQSN